MFYNNVESIIKTKQFYTYARVCRQYVFGDAGCVYSLHRVGLLPKDHWRFGPYTPIFLISRTLLLSVWCDACSISAIGESHGKSQLAKYFQNSYALERYGG